MCTRHFRRQIVALLYRNKTIRYIDMLPVWCTEVPNPSRRTPSKLLWSMNRTQMKKKLEKDNTSLLSYITYKNIIVHLPQYATTFCFIRRTFWCFDGPTADLEHHDPPTAALPPSPVTTCPVPVTTSTPPKESGPPSANPQYYDPPTESPLPPRVTSRPVRVRKPPKRLEPETGT